MTFGPILEASSRDSFETARVAPTRQRSICRVPGIVKLSTSLSYRPPSAKTSLRFDFCCLVWKQTPPTCSSCLKQRSGETRTRFCKPRLEHICETWGGTQARSSSRGTQRTCLTSCTARLNLALAAKLSFAKVSSTICSSSVRQISIRLSHLAEKRYAPHTSIAARSSKAFLLSPSLASSPTTCDHGEARSSYRSRALRAVARLLADKASRSDSTKSK